MEKETALQEGKTALGLMSKELSEMLSEMESQLETKDEKHEMLIEAKKKEFNAILAAKDQEYQAKSEEYEVALNNLADLDEKLKVWEQELENVRQQLDQVNYKANLLAQTIPDKAVVVTRVVKKEDESPAFADKTKQEDNSNSK